MSDGSHQENSDRELLLRTFESATRTEVCVQAMKRSLDEARAERQRIRSDLHALETRTRDLEGWRGKIMTVAGIVSAGVTGIIYATKDWFGKFFH